MSFYGQTRQLLYQLPLQLQLLDEPLLANAIGLLLHVLFKINVCNFIRNFIIPSKNTMEIN